MFLNMRVIFRLVENRKNNNMKMDLSHADMLKGAQCAMSKYYAWRDTSVNKERESESALLFTLKCAWFLTRFLR